MAALQDEIDRLEQENVGKRDWTLRGEAGGRVRPQNSLLEEDLEFESAGKAKPIITGEVTAGLEDMIKARILEGRFDDVVRRRNLEATAFLPSRLLELSDAKSQKSLAQLYEDDYAKAREEADGQAASTPAADAKLQKEHDEIDAVFDDICGKLDALSNAHYTPKAVSRWLRPCEAAALTDALHPLRSPRRRSRRSPTRPPSRSRVRCRRRRLPRQCWRPRRSTTPAGTRRRWRATAAS
jgi:U3 small nucleolar ribonucleoprotein component